MTDITAVIRKAEAIEWRLPRSMYHIPTKVSRPAPFNMYELRKILPAKLPETVRDKKVMLQ